MKYLSRTMTAVLLPVQVFADTPDYISDIKIYAGSCSGKRRKDEAVPA